MLTQAYQQGAFTPTGSTPTKSYLPFTDDHPMDDVVRVASAEFNASRSNSVYGSSSYVRPNSRKVIMLIKF